jgi:hypothetical protein
MICLVDAALIKENYMKVDIIRVHSSKVGTFGVLRIDGMPIGVTGEQDWEDNKKGVSCIPIGQYLCQRVNTPIHGDTFEVTGVPGRTSILFHKGNLPLEHSEGCILVAEQFELLNNKRAVLASAKGYGEFMGRMEGVSTFVLNIIEIKL